MVVTDDDEVSSKISDSHDLIEKFLIANISNNSMKKLLKRFLFVLIKTWNPFKLVVKYMEATQIVDFIFEANQLWCF